MINTQNVWWDFKAFTLTCKSFLPKPDGPTSRVVFFWGNTACGYGSKEGVGTGKPGAIKW